MCKATITTTAVFDAGFFLTKARNGFPKKKT